MSQGSVSFDRVAAYRDETPVTDAESLRTILDLLETEVCGRGPVLELGVGTGQLALSLGGAYARWVLHLIPDRIQAPRELDRTVTAGGNVAIEPGRFSGPFRETYLRFKQILGDALVAVGLTAADRDRELDEGIASIGWALQREVPVVYEHAIGDLDDLMPAEPTP